MGGASSGDSVLEGVGCLYPPLCREGFFSESGLPVFSILGNLACIRPSIAYHLCDTGAYRAHRSLLRVEERTPRVWGSPILSRGSVGVIRGLLGALGESNRPYRAVRIFILTMS